MRPTIISAAYNRLPNNQTDITTSMRFVDGNKFPIGHPQCGSKPPPKKIPRFKFSSSTTSSIPLHSARLPSAGVSNQVHETAWLLLSRGSHFMDWGAAVDLVILPIDALVTTSRRNKSLGLTYSAAAVPYSCTAALPLLSSSVPGSVPLLHLNRYLDSVHH